MTTLTGAEAAELGRSVRAVCTRLATESRVREVLDSAAGVDVDLWRVLCTQVDVAAIAMPAELGGAGFDAAALGVVAHELGRVLAAVPLLSSAVLASGLLTGSPDPPPDVIAALVAGECTAAAVVTESVSPWGRGGARVHAHRIGRTWSLSGAARHVLGGTAADYLVVIATPATVAGGSSVFLVDCAATGLTRTPERVLDPTRPMATVAFENVSAQLLIGPDLAYEVIGRALDRTVAVLSAEQVGTHERILEIASAYAVTRHQFGRPIGSFQAIKHRCADMLVGLEWARSASQTALQSVDDDPPGSAAEVRWRTSMAKAVCSEALREAAHANLQIHGGIGFTWDHSAHLYLRRARTDEVLFGGPALHWDRVTMEAELI